MPIYEFYCADCHTIYNFFSRRIDTERRPDCPACGRHALVRQASLFAVSKGRKETDGDPLGDVDEDRMGQAMRSLAGEMEQIDEQNPRQAAALMRRLYDAAGLGMTASMDEAMRRMEAGEDPDRIEAEMGDFLADDEPFAGKPRQHLNDLRRKLLPPQVDETLYDL